MDTLNELKKFWALLGEYRNLVADDSANRDSIQSLRTELQRIYYRQRHAITKYSGGGNDVNIFDEAFEPVETMDFLDLDRSEKIRYLDECIRITNEAIAKFEGEQQSRKALDKGEAFVVEPEGSESHAWQKIEQEYGISKRTFGKRINFVKDPFKRKVIFRDIEHAFILARCGYNKPSVVLAGGVIEELLRLYLEKNNIKPRERDLNSYIEACNDHELLKGAIQDLAHSVRQFRNIVHLREESSSRHTISNPTAKGAVASIFTIVNDFQIGT